MIAVMVPVKSAQKRSRTALSNDLFHPLSAMLLKRVGGSIKTPRPVTVALDCDRTVSHFLAASDFGLGVCRDER